MRSAIAVIKIALFFLWSLLCVPPQLVVLLFHRGKKAYLMPWIWHKGVCLIFRIKVQISGKPDQSKQTLYVSNHLSYLDIPAIGMVLRASFVAKKDVKNWPVFGFLSKMQQTAFIDRNRKAAIQEKTSLSGMISDGKSLIIFPEGTSTDGREVLPFKSSLFSLALSDSDKSLCIQPFFISILISAM
ncbi:MAG: lysophospholipid acyltransferase family protein [Bacteroidota bacterium]